MREKTVTVRIAFGVGDGVPRTYRMSLSDWKSLASAFDSGTVTKWKSKQMMIDISKIAWMEANE